MSRRRSDFLVAIFSVLVLVPYASRADITNWQTGQTIPGTEGITPGSGIDLSSRADGTGPWNTDAQNLRYADFSGGLDLSESRFSYDWLDNARFSQANLTDAVVSRADFQGATSRGFTREQLYSTASYKAKDLQEINLSYNDLSGWDFAGQNLAGAYFWWNAALMDANLSQAKLVGASFSFASLTGANLTQANLAGADLYSATLTGANLSGSDMRGAKVSSLAGAMTDNTIYPDGSLQGLELRYGRMLLVRDYDGDASHALPPLPITVEHFMAADATSRLRLIFEKDAWDSLIRFEPGIPVTLDGTLELTFASDVHVAEQTGRTFQLFDWSGVSPTGTFSVVSDYSWDLSNLYTTGEVILVPEPATLGLLLSGLLTLAVLRLWSRKR